MREPATGAALATKSEKSSAAWYAISLPAEMPVRWMAYRHSLAHTCTRTVLVSTGPPGGLLLQVEAERRAQPPEEGGDQGAVVHARRKVAAPGRVAARAAVVALVPIWFWRVEQGTRAGAGSFLSPLAAHRSFQPSPLYRGARQVGPCGPGSVLSPLPSTFHARESPEYASPDPCGSATTMSSCHSSTKKASRSSLRSLLAVS